MKLEELLEDYRLNNVKEIFEKLTLSQMRSIHADLYCALCYADMDDEEVERITKIIRRIDERYKKGSV